ncbi:MAG: hypothetical protein BWY72_01970 [Bacteroidetes bacterium ADurb.Bin416]|nr:MAG: hypothetical protein BWY72_01970 [Bacteroidetes bacterium ADurb.Bin416]
MLGNFQGLFAAVGLGNPQVFDVNTQLFSVEAVEGVFGVDESGDATGFLSLGDGVDGQGGFTGGFRAVDFDDTASGVATDAQGGVQTDGSAGDHSNVYHSFVAHLHDGAFAVVLFNFFHCGLEGFELFIGRCLGFNHVFFFCHGYVCLVCLIR